ncbi:BT1926 family outer membrane beta-barrel protein [Odoribacter splanchnicus]|uniref:BT1926 family outer membrane beta-barrel protein n=2 Tax=Odoribacter TaxID=283168 RepID=UPI000E4C4AA5|nr:BT1926 family outer membrane beta-barrel protein [Odoribacter splanchnicus]RHA38047.1 hypothetical protein DW936_18950 [Odoribacter splanchnicus]
MTKKIFAILLFMGIVFLGQAQTTHNEFAPKKGDKMVSLNLGAGSAVGIEAPLPDLGTYTVTAPHRNWLDKGLSMDVEFRWMFAQKWALKLRGGVSYGFGPEYSALPGTAEGDEAEIGDIPNYSFVPESNRLQYQAGLGCDRYVATRYQRLFFYYGLEAGFAYGRSTANAEDETYSGKAVGETFNINGSFVTGFQYFIADAIYTGIEICPVGYSYAVNNLRPQAGVKMLSADTHQFNFLASPMIKLGFRF